MLIKDEKKNNNNCKRTFSRQQGKCEYGLSVTWCKGITVNFVKCDNDIVIIK